MIKKILIGLGALIILFIVIAVVSGPSEPTKVGEEKTAPAAMQDFRIGDRINIQDRILTVKSVDKKWKSSNQFDKPTSPNKVFIVVAVAIENTSKSEVSFNPFDFKIQDANGVQSSMGIGGIGVDKLSSGQLAAGGKVSGSIIFEVNQDATQNLILLYQPSFWSGQTARILLQ